MSASVNEPVTGALLHTPGPARTLAEAGSGQPAAAVSQAFRQPDIGAVTPRCTRLHTRSAPEVCTLATEETTMKKSRGGRMTAAKKRAAKRKGGKGPVTKRSAGRNIMKT